MRNSSREYYEHESLRRAGLAEVRPGERDRIATIRGMLPDDAHVILDVGCGDGIVTNALTDRTVVAVDFARRALAYVATPYRVRAAIDALPLRSGTADLVMINEVLEHLPQDVLDRTVAELARVARRYVLVNTPFDEPLELNHTRCDGCGCTFHLYRHVRRFRLQTFERLLPGFRLVDVQLCGDRWVREPVWPHRLARAIGNYYAWHPAARCPQCDAPVLEPARSVVVRRLMAAWGRLYRGVGRAWAVEEEVVALYSRVSEAASSARKRPVSSESPEQE